MMRFTTVGISGVHALLSGIEIPVQRSIFLVGSSRNFLKQGSACSTVVPSISCATLLALIQLWTLFKLFLIMIHFVLRQRNKSERPRILRHNFPLLEWMNSSNGNDLGHGETSSKKVKALSSKAPLERAYKVILPVLRKLGSQTKS